MEYCQKKWTTTQHFPVPNVPRKLRYSSFWSFDPISRSISVSQVASDRARLQDALGPQASIAGCSQDLVGSHNSSRQKTAVYIVYIYHILIYDSDLLILDLHYKQINDIYIYTYYIIYIIHSISHDASLSSVFSIISKNSHLVQPTTSKRSSHQHSQTLPGSL